MSPNRKPRDSAEIPEEVKAEVLARVYEFILSLPMPSREPKLEEAVTESPGDSAESPEDPRAEAVTESPNSAENRDSSPNNPEKIRAGSGKSRDSSPLREETPSAGNLPESPEESHEL